MVICHSLSVNAFSNLSLPSGYHTDLLLEKLLFSSRRLFVLNRGDVGSAECSIHVRLQESLRVLSPSGLGLEAHVSFISVCGDKLQHLTQEILGLFL